MGYNKLEGTTSREERQNDRLCAWMLRPYHYLQKSKDSLSINLGKA